MTSSDKIPGTKLSMEALGGDTDAQRRFTSRVAVTAAVLAALAAVSGSLSSSHLSQAMLAQIEASDQWNFFQAKGIKRGLVESKIEITALLDRPPGDTDTANVARYKAEQDEIMGAARGHQAGAQRHRHQHNRLGHAATCAQIAIALTAVALLTKRSWAWWMALALGAGAATLLGMGLMGA